MATFRLHIIFLTLVSFAVVLVGRLFTLQVHDYGMFAAFAYGQQQVVAELEPERGSVFGIQRDGTLVSLATNRDFPSVYAIPRDIEDLSATIALLRDVLSLDDTDAEALEARLAREDDPYEPVAKKLTQAQEASIMEADFPGIVLTKSRERFYPLESRLAHVLGFVGFDAYGEKRGVYGIEAYFESALKGVSGKLRGERDGQGTILQAFAQTTSPPTPGADVILTIDPNIQYQAEKFLAEAVEEWSATGGTVIVMEPRTGALRALANEPVFDPNNFGDEKDVSVYLNPAASVAYEPGSVFKIVTMAAALDSGALSPETTYENTGSVYISGYTISNTLQQYNGVRTMIEVLRYSLNTGAIFVEKQTGHETFVEYVEDFGFGAPVGIALPGEAAGSVENLYTGREINYATAAFGQGISVTPLQFVSAVSTIANGGVRLHPYIVQEVRYPDGTVDVTEPVTVGRVLTQRTATRLSAMMTRVVDDGGAIRARIEGYSIAGKTGTAQIPRVGVAGYEEQHIHTFVGFFPAFDPRYVILVKIDRPQGVRYAASTAAPLFRDIAEYLITYAAIPPDNPVHSSK